MNRPEFKDGFCLTCNKKGLVWTKPNFWIECKWCYMSRA